MAFFVRCSWSISFVTSRTNVDFSSAVKSRPGLPRSSWWSGRMPTAFFIWSIVRWQTAI